MLNDLRRPTGVDSLPRVWLLLGHKRGDNTQVRALAEALGWPYECKKLVYRKYELATNLLLGCTLAGIVRGESSPLDPPWPDLVISAGRRNEPVSRWIQKQADRQVRLVHLGRPWAPLRYFDLIVTTPQYRLPRRANVLHNTMPLHGITTSRLSEAAAAWSPRLAHLQRPYTAVLVGGHSGAFTFDLATARRLGHEASAMTKAAGGSLLVTTSARTPSTSTDALASAIDVPVHFFRWSPHSVDNPYDGYLALADSFIVTPDSMSMLTEACVTQKPVYIFDPSKASVASMPTNAGADRHQRWWQRWRQLRVRNIVYWLAMRIGPRQLTRDVRIIHELLVSSGRAAWLGDKMPPEAPPAPLEDLQRAVTRVRALLCAEELG